MWCADGEDSLDQAIAEGDGVIWIRKQFTNSQKIAEEQAKGRTDKTVEELVLEEFISF